MASEISYLCRRCGERHDGLPMSYGTDAPAYWDPSLADDESSMLDQEQCIIKAEHFFIRGRLVIPVTDALTGTEFDWGVWVSLSRDNFARALSRWTTAARRLLPAGRRVIPSARRSAATASRRGMAACSATLPASGMNLGPDWPRD